MAILNPSTASIFGSNNFVPRGYIDGLILGYSSATAIAWNTGECSDDNKSTLITNSTQFTKSLASGFAIGNGNGGLDTGSKANSTWYHCYIIKNGSGAIDGLFSTNATSPTMPSGFIYKRRIGSVLTDGSGNILSFYQLGDMFKYLTPISDVTAGTWGTSATLVTISTPLGISTTPLLSYCGAVLAGSAITIYVTSPYDTDGASAYPNDFASSPTNSYKTYADGLNYQIRTNTSSQIRVRCNSANCTGYVATAGWIDPRGKDN